MLRLPQSLGPISQREKDVQGNLRLISHNKMVKNHNQLKILKMLKKMAPSQNPRKKDHQKRIRMGKHSQQNKTRPNTERRVRVINNLLRKLEVQRAMPSLSWMRMAKKRRRDPKHPSPMIKTLRPNKNIDQKVKNLRQKRARSNQQLLMVTNLRRLKRRRKLRLQRTLSIITQWISKRKRNSNLNGMSIEMVIGERALERLSSHLRLSFQKNLRSF